MLRSTALSLIVGAAALLPLGTRAETVTFHYTGRITDTVLQSGILQPSAPSSFLSAWIGQPVSGTLSFNFTPREPTVLDPGHYSQVGATLDQPDASWLSMTVNQPDGSMLVIPSGPVLGLHVDPSFCPECNDAYSYLANGWVSAGDNGVPQSGFYAQRTLINGLEAYPRQQFQLHVRGTGAASSGLTDSIDYRQVHFDVGRANWDNYGYVDDYPSAGHHASYAFTVLSLGLQVPAVPEPGVPLLAGAGLLVMGMLMLMATQRRRRAGTARPAGA